MQTNSHGRYDAEVAATAAQCPKQKNKTNNCVRTIFCCLRPNKYIVSIRSKSVLSPVRMATTA
jgi:hypothetical protein